MKKKISISYGIIALQVTEHSLYIKVKNAIKRNTKLTMCDIDCLTDSDRELCSDYKNKIKFLMIAKKHTYGFSEIINGKYDVFNRNQIFHLLKQTTIHEFNRIISDDFRQMWIEVQQLTPYEVPEDNPYYQPSFDKFLKLRETLTNYDKINHNYVTTDWEFPKGHKNSYNEDTMKCAIREFKEETNLSRKDFYVFKNIEPINEIFKGTDNNYYHYIYYLALLKENVTFSHSNNLESDIIGTYSIEEAIDKIRDYNKIRKSVTYYVFSNILNWVVNYNNSKKPTNPDLNPYSFVISSDVTDKISESDSDSSISSLSDISTKSYSKSSDSDPDVSHLSSSNCNNDDVVGVCNNDNGDCVDDDGDDGDGDYYVIDDDSSSSTDLDCLTTTSPIH